MSLNFHKYLVIWHLFKDRVYMLYIFIVMDVVLAECGISKRHLCKCCLLYAITYIGTISKVFGGLFESKVTTRWLKFCINIGNCLWSVKILSYCHLDATKCQYASKHLHICIIFCSRSYNNYLTGTYIIYIFRFT